MLTRKSETPAVLAHHLLPAVLQLISELRQQPPDATVEIRCADYAQILAGAVQMARVGAD
jgi:hypothetical protein